MEWALFHRIGDDSGPRRASAFAILTERIGLSERWHRIGAEEK
jgi:hypothetical protein